MTPGLRRWAWPAVLATGVAAGLALRVGTLLSRLGALDSDEAVVGLMAEALLDGHTWAFFWGQHYAGTIETTVVAAVFALIGSSVIALKSLAVVLCGVSALLLWRVGRRLVDERTAQVAALLFWVGPAAFLWFGTKTRGFYWASLVLGLVVLLAALRVDQEGDRRRDWVVLGLAGGLGWWSSPTIAYFALPAVVWLVARRPDRVRRSWPAVPAFALGALPWLWHNVGRGFPSLEMPEQVEQISYLDGVGRLSWKVVPIVLGLRRPVSGIWFGAGALVYLAVLVVVVVAVVRRPDRPRLAVLSVVVFPWLYALFPGRWWVGEARYALFLSPMLFLLLAWTARRPVAQVSLVVAMAGLSLVGLESLGSEQPRDVAADIAALERADVRHAWADYWVSHRLAFESEGRVVSTSLVSPRHRPFVAEVAGSSRPAWIYPHDDPRAPGLERLLAGLGVGTRRLRTPNFDVVVADQPVSVAQVPAELRV